ncbi:unnamed protein product [Rotaria sordida]|uniref:Uncharacterized protein n=1 Tax=Rotaria sordida TaxID=392033 RepID=A0A815CV45_9BILA|nr:unnamed protein product [Rotaria sordida]CAF3900688.1 unnamed protein product [Rotaria sordida]
MASSTTKQQQFLNSLTTEEINDFKTALLPPGCHLDLVNHRHVDSSLDLDQLATMKSIRSLDGAFFISNSTIFETKLHDLFVFLLDFE